MLIQALALFGVVVAVQVALVFKVAEFMTAPSVRTPAGNRDLHGLGKSKTA
jgi:hypothetical protein